MTTTPAKQSFDDHLWEVAGDTCLNRFTSIVVRWKLPFGKFEGIEIADVPVAYLFETMADMRPSLVVTAIQQLLRDEAVMTMIAVFATDGKLPRAITLKQMLIEYLAGDPGAWPIDH